MLNDSRFITNSNNIFETLWYSVTSCVGKVLLVFQNWDSSLLSFLIGSTWILIFFNRTLEAILPRKENSQKNSRSLLTKKFQPYKLGKFPFENKSPQISEFRIPIFLHLILRTVFEMSGTLKGKRQYSITYIEILEMIW